MALNDGLQSSDKGVKRLIGVIFLGPEGVANLCLGERMIGRVEKHFHQLLLHGRKFYVFAFCIEESAF